LSANQNTKHSAQMLTEVCAKQQQNAKHTRTHTLTM